LKIIFTPTGGSPATLADHTASPAINAVIEQWGGQCVVQTEKRYGQSAEIDFPRGNVGGDFVFTAGCSYDDYDDTLAAFVTAFGLLNLQGALVVTYIPGATTATMPNAVLRDVRRTVLNGLRLELRYTFKITTITSP
jgi:hypothetical protein